MTLPAGRPPRRQASSIRFWIQARRSVTGASSFMASGRSRPIGSIGLGRLQIEDALAGLALDQAAFVADLHHHLGADPVVAGGAVPLALLLARPYDDANRRHGPAGIPLEDAFEVRHDTTRELLAQGGDLGLE